MSERRGYRSPLEVLTTPFADVKLTYRERGLMLAGVRALRLAAFPAFMAIVGAGVSPAYALGLGAAGYVGVCLEARATRPRQSPH
jgi:hypothetical protein